MKGQRSTGSGALAAAARRLEVVAEHADRVRAATLAVAHLLDVRRAPVLHLALLGRGRRHDVLEPVLWDDRDQVEGIRPELRGRLGDLDDLVVVDARDPHRVDLDDHPALGGLLDPLELVRDQDLRGLDARVVLPVVVDVVVDLRADLRVERVHRDRDVADVEGRELVDPLGEHEPVRRDAPDRLGEVLLDQPEGLEGLLVRQRVARTRDPDHLDELVLLEHVLDQGDGLLRRNDPAGHARARLVDAVVVALAVVALDVALGRHGEVHPAEGVAGLLGEARVLLDPAERGRVVRDLSAVDGCGGIAFGHCESVRFSRRGPINYSRSRRCRRPIARSYAAEASSVRPSAESAFERARCRPGRSGATSRARSYASSASS